jgi:thiol-disulfide isomerase/thioredoxin
MEVKMNARIFRLALFLGLAGLVVLSACSGGAKPTETAAPTEAPALQAPTEAYPAPAAAAPTTPAGAAYPIPTATLYNPYPAPVVTPYNPYPEPTQGSSDQPSGSATQPAGAGQQEMVASNPASVQLASGKVQLVEFFAFWDGTSQAMAPVVLGLESKYGDRMNFVYLDIDDPANAAFKQQLGFKLQPQFFLLDAKGNLLKQWSGSVEAADLQAAIDATLK